MDRTRSVARIVGCGLAGLLVVGGLAVVPQAISAPRAAAAPTGYVKVSDGTRIAVNVRMPTNYVDGQEATRPSSRCRATTAARPNGGTLAQGLRPQSPVAEVPGVAAPDRRQPATHRHLQRRLRDGARLGARHRLLEWRVRPVLLALGARRQGDHRRLDPEPDVVERLTSGSSATRTAASRAS